MSLTVTLAGDFMFLVNYNSGLAFSVGTIVIQDINGNTCFSDVVKWNSSFILICDE